MAFFSGITNIYSTIKNYLNEQKRTTVPNKPYYLFERHIGYGLQIGLGNCEEHISETPITTTKQLLHYNDNYYELDNLQQSENKLNYQWCDMQNQDNKLILEFEKKTDDKIYFKLLDAKLSDNDNINTPLVPKNILEIGLFNHKLYKKINMPETKDIDVISDFSNNII